jgi:hypothetical protein
MKNFVGEKNRVSSSARGCIVTGSNNFVGYACKNITLTGCTNCTVLPNVSNATLVNCNGLMVTESNTTIVNNATTKKVSLNTTQIKNLNSVPIDTGISVGAGQAIEVISACVNWNGGTTPFFSFTYLSLIIDTATYGWYPPISDYSTNHFVPFVFDQSVGVDYIENKRLMITADADSANGNGSADIYINYRIITL